MELTQKKWKNKPFYIILGIVMFVLLISHSYNDILITTRHGINFWSILARGELFNFYNLNITRSGNDFYAVEQSCAYHIFVYLVFAIWNIPLLFVTVFTDIEVMNNVFCVIWAKLLPATALFFSVFLMQGIMKECFVSKKMQEIATFLYLSSALVVSTIFVTGGYDILCVCLMLLGFRAYLQGKHRWFLFWFAIAICFKYFALLAFVPLLLRKEKRVLFLLRDGVLSLSIYLLTSLPFSLMTTKSSGLETYLFKLVFASESDIIHWFVIAFGAICIVAYACKTQDATYEKNMAIWLVFGGYASFFAFCNAYPYWIAFLMPFMVLLIANNEAHYSLNLLLETAGSLGLLMNYYITQSWCYFYGTLNGMVWKYFTPDLATGSPGALEIVVLTSEMMRSMFRSAFILACLALLYMNRPQKATKLPDGNFNIKYDVFILRFIAMVFFVLTPIISMLTKIVYTP